MISGISGLQGYQGLGRTMENQARQDAHKPAQLAEIKDTVSINPAVEMTDEEAQKLLQEVSADIGVHQTEALSVHQGLSYDRIMALLGDI